VDAFAGLQPPRLKRHDRMTAFGLDAAQVLADGVDIVAKTPGVRVARLSDFGNHGIRHSSSPYGSSGEQKQVSAQSPSQARREPSRLRIWSGESVPSFRMNLAWGIVITF
jgi:hypothetical protein